MGAFSSGFSGCLGVGCAVIFVLVALPAGCLFLGGLGVYEATRPIPADIDSTPQANTQAPVVATPEAPKADGQPATVVHATKSTPPVAEKAATEPNTTPIVRVEQIPAVPYYPWRIWTDSTRKHRIEAQFVRLKDGKVRLRKVGGEEIEVSVDKLSHADLQWAERQK